MMSVGACCLLAVCVAMPPPDAAFLWTLPPIVYPAAPDPVRTAIRHPGDRWPIRRHDGTDRTWDEASDPGAFVAPPPLPRPEPPRAPNGDDPIPQPPPDTDAWLGANTARLGILVARLNSDTDERFVALCERLMIDPVAVVGDGRRNTRKGNAHAHGRTAQAEGRNVRGDHGVPADDGHRGRRRSRGGMRV